MKVLVIGATGYVGAAIAGALAQRGHPVTALARSEHARTALAARGYEVVDGDAARPHSLFGPARAADAIVYAVSVTDDDPYSIDSAALKQLVEAAKNSSRCLIYTSGIGCTAPPAKRSLRRTRPFALPPSWYAVPNSSASF